MENEELRKGLDFDTTEYSEKITKPKEFRYDVKYFNKRKAQMDVVFNQIRPKLQELSEYFAPRTSRFIVSDVNKPIKDSKKILNSITLTSVKNFASGMQSGATSAATRWFKCCMAKKELNSLNEVKVWCNQEEELIRKILLQSNFYPLMYGAYKQVGIYGMAVLSIEPDYKNVVNFKLLPVGSYRYSRDNRGEVDTVCRHYQEKAQNIVREYGYENCSEAVKSAYDNNSDASFELVYFVEPNKEYKKNSPLSKHKRYISAHYEVGSDKFLRLSGFDRFPFAIFESEVNGEDNYPSNCPGIEALPDAKQLMFETKEYSKALKKLVSPLYKGPASLQKQKGLTDAAGEIVTETDDGRGLSPVYEVPPKIIELRENIKELEQKIKEHFYNDLFAVILNTAERGRTATEVNEIKEEKMVLLSPLLDQFHKGFRYVHDWIFEETERTEIMPVPPDILEGEEMNIEFISSLALAQKVKGISSIERFTTFTVNLAQSVDPTLTKKINADKIVDDYADIANVSPEHVVSTEDVNKMREQIAQQQAQEKQMQALQQSSEMIKNMGGVDAFGANLANRLGVG